VSFEIALTLSDDQVEAIARRAAELLPPAANAISPWLDTRAAAKYLCCPVGRIHDLVQLRKLDPYRDGRRLLFRREDLDAYLEASR
jgi:excisionase family DNA binding protein